MVTLEKEIVNIYRLHFIDEFNCHHYQIVLSKNINTVNYYAKKLMISEGWFLIDYHEITIDNNNLWVTKHIIRYKVTHRGIRREVYSLTDTYRNFL